MIQVLTSQDVEVMAILCISHIATTMWHLPFENDRDPRVAHEVHVSRVLRTLELLSRRDTTTFLACFRRKGTSSRRVLP